MGARIFRSQEQELVGGRGARERRVGLHDHQIAVDVDDVVRVVDALTAGAHGFMFRRSEGAQRVAGMMSVRREEQLLRTRGEMA